FRLPPPRAGSTASSSCPKPRTRSRKWPAAPAIPLATCLPKRSNWFGARSPISTWKQPRAKTSPPWARSSAKNCPPASYFMNELSLVEKLRAMAGAKNLILGIGDDCAVYRPKAGEDLIFTTDQSIEGVHFTSSLAPAAAGERALARALSDIAAMGGEPRF